MVWATASRLDQEDAARWLRQELGSRQVPAKDLRAAAAEAGIPWHVVYRAKGIAGADCGRVGSGAGSHFVWSLFDLVEDEETKWNGHRGAERIAAAVPTETEQQETEVDEATKYAKSSIENTKTGQEDGGRAAADGGLPSEPPSGFAARPFGNLEPSVPGSNAGSARRREGRWRAESGNEKDSIQNEFSDPAAVTEVRSQESGVRGEV